MVKRYSILTSYLIGAPLGILTVILFFFLPAGLSGEGLATMAIIGAYGKAIIGLVLTFIIALGIAGLNAYKNISKNNSLILASFKYSVTVNFIIWTTFILITIADNTDNYFLIIPPLIAFFISVIITTVTIGLVICYLIKRRLQTVEHIRHI